MDDLVELERAAKAADQKARDARDALAAAKWKKAEERMEPLKGLVERAHNALCQWNHTDGCSWGYEEGVIDPWRCAAHTQWLGHYDRLINGSDYTPPTCTLVEAEEVIAAIETLKPKVKTAVSLLRGKLTP